MNNRIEAYNAAYAPRAFCFVQLTRRPFTTPPFTK